MAEYLKTGNRISLLPITRFCGKSGVLSEEHGAGRPAAMSTAFHARMADPSSEDTRRKLLLLTEKERQDISLWKKPADVPIWGGQILSYSTAEKEVPVALSQAGDFVENGECLTSGTLDMGWVLPGVVYVGDIKKSRWTVDGPDTLQLQAYAWAYARKHQRTRFATGIWIAEEGEWQWSEEVDMESFKGLETWELIAHAASNRDPEARTGPHCSGCYARLHCAEHLAPAALAETWLAPATKGEIEPGELVSMLLVAERVQALIERVKEHAQIAVDRGVELRAPDGRVYKAIHCKGRDGFDYPALLRDHPEMNKYFFKGKPYFQHRWSKR